MDWNNSEQVLKALLYVYINRNGNTGGIIPIDSEHSAILNPIAESILLKDHGVSRYQFDRISKILKYYSDYIVDTDISTITLPSTAKVHFLSTVSTLDGDGLLRINKNTLEFVPNIYPTSQLSSYGFIWNARNYRNLWSSFVSRDKINAVIRVFPNTIKDKSVLDWEKLQDSYTDPSENDSIYGTGDLLDKQKETIQYMLSHNRALLGLAPGTGKTVCALHAARLLGGITLIVCPLTLVRNWKREIKAWLDEDAEIWHGYIPNTEIDKYWYITNYETVLNHFVTYDIKRVLKNGKYRKERVNWRCTFPVDNIFDNIVIDESILIKNRKAQRTKACETIAKNVRSAWLLSGAPIAKFYDDMWSQLHVLNPKVYSSYWRFAGTYCIVEQTKWGYNIAGNEKNAATILKEDLKDIYFSLSQEEVVDLPDWIMDSYEIDMLKDQYKLYLEMEETFIAELPDGDIVLAPNILSQLTRLIQFASNPLLVGGPNLGAKWNAVPEILEYEKFPVIIWTNFIKTAECITKELLSLKHRVETLTGATSPHNRDKIVNEFQDGNIDIIVAHPAVGKFGLTLTRARTCIYLERSYNGDDYYQSLYRVKRIGTKHSPHIIHLLATRPGSNAPTVDHVIDKVLKFRKDSNIAITSGLIRDAFRMEP